jgi:amino acid transporter
MRCLYGLALQGHAPRFLTKCLKNGIPIYCFAIVMLFPFLTFFQVSAGTAKVVSLLQSLTSASGLINYVSLIDAYSRTKRLTFPDLHWCYLHPLPPCHQGPGS